MQCLKRFSLWKDVIVPLWFESFMCNTEWRGVFKLCQDSSDVMISFLKYKSSSIFSHRAIYNVSSQVICSVILLYEWMNELCIYIAFYCVLLYTQSALHSCGWVGGWVGGGCSIHQWMMWWLPLDNGASALSTHQLHVERRESDGANQVDGDY